MAVPTETLRIEGFAGIKSAELKVKPFTLLIGPQSSGKSVTAKVLYYFRGIVEDIIRAAQEQCSWKDFELRCEQRFLSFFPRDCWAKPSFRLELEMSEESFVVESPARNGRHLKLKLPAFLMRELESLRGDFSKEKDDIDWVISGEDDYIQRGRKELGATVCLNQRFVPAGRAFFAYLEQDVFSFLDSGSLDPFISEFGKAYALLRRRMVDAEATPKRPTKYLQDAGTLIAGILRGSYQRAQKRDFIRMKDGRVMPLRHCSSGQQESLPLSMFLKDLITRDKSDKTPTSLTVEEPEAHLFPDSQRAVVELIACAFNASPALAQVFITTHSPYILGAVNLLMKAGELHECRLQVTKQRKLEQIIPATRTLNKGSVAAYLLDDGKCSDLIAKDTGLIDDNPVDATLSRMGGDFDQLLDLEG